MAKKYKITSFLRERVKAFTPLYSGSELIDIKWERWVSSLVANKWTVSLKFKLFIIFSKYFRFITHSVLVSCFLDSTSASSLNIPGMLVAVILLPYFKIKFYIRCTTQSISIDLVLPILLIVTTADVLSIWIIIRIL